MRKSGPFRSIRLCAKTPVGAASGVVVIVAAGARVPPTVAESSGWLASLVDRRCQAANASNRVHTDTRTARRARIQNYSMVIREQVDRIECALAEIPSQSRSRRDHAPFKR